MPESDKYELYGFKLETETRQYFVRCFAEQDSHFAIYAYGDKPAPVIEQTMDVLSSEKRVKTEQEQGGKPTEKEKDGYTSVLKAIEDGKKTPKLPRKAKKSGQHKNKDA